MTTTTSTEKKSSLLPDQIECWMPYMVDIGNANDCEFSVLTGDQEWNHLSKNKNIQNNANDDNKPDPLLSTETPCQSNASRSRTDSMHSHSSVELDAPTSCCEAFSAAWTRTVYSCQRPIRNSMVSIAVTSARYPIIVVVLSLLVSISVMLIGYYTNFILVEDPVQLWGIQGSRVLQDRDWVHNAFVPAEEEQDASYVTILVHKHGENVITKDGMRTILTILDRIRDNDVTGYQDFCSNYGSPVCTTNRQLACLLNGISVQPPTITCPIYSVTAPWFHNTTIFEARVESDDDVLQYFSALHLVLNLKDKPWSFDVESFVGFPEYQGDSLVSGKSLTTFIRLPRENSKYPDENGAIAQGAAVLENKIIQALGQLQLEWDGDFAFEFQSSSFVPEESKSGMYRQIFLLPLVFLVLVIFTALVVYKNFDWLISQLILAMGAVICVALSILMGFGILFAIGIPFTYLALFCAFVVFALGLHHSFLLYTRLIQTENLTNDFEKRVHETMDRIGIGIFLTSATPIVAFAIGSLVDVQAVRWLSLYALSSIASNFLLQVTFFVAWIALDQRRIRYRGKNCLCFLHVPGCDVLEPSKNTNDDRVQQINTCSTNWMQSYSQILMYRWVRIIVVVLFLEFLVLCTWRASRLQVVFSLQSTLPAKSSMVQLADSKKEFTRKGPSLYIYFRNVDQSDPFVQEQMEAFVYDMVNIDAISDPPTKFWLRDFKRYIFNETSLPGMSFNDTLFSFLRDDKYKGYRNDIMIDDFYNIEASRTLAAMENVNLSDINHGLEAFSEQWTVSTGSRQPINHEHEVWPFFMFDELFVMWEFLSLVPRHIAITCITAFCSVTVMSLLFLPHWSGSLFALVMVISLYIEFLGILQFTGQAMNDILFVCVSIAIGFLVNCIMNVTLAYYESSLLTRGAKAKDALIQSGTPVLLGGISSFLSMFPLLFFAGDIMQTFLVSFVSVIVLGLLHGLVLLPVVFSLFGPV